MVIRQMTSLEPVRGRFGRSATILVAVLVAGACMPSAAQAYRLTVEMYGAGKLDETTTRNLMDCTSPNTLASAARWGQDCIAGSPADVYNYGDIVDISAVVPDLYAAEGWRFAYWISNDGGGRVNCDGAEDASNHNTTGNCRFQMFENLSMGAVFVDEGTPETDAITGTPAEGSRTNTTNGNFGFSSPDTSASLQCSWNTVDWFGCTGTPALTEGAQTLYTRALDPSGHADATPSTRSFVIDRTPPQTAITSQPPVLTNSQTASFSFGSSYAGGPSPESFGGFRCRLDTAVSFSDCSSGSLSYSNLAEGPHFFEVKAFDTAGNEDQSPASYSWTVDSVPPDTAITQGPPGSTESATATFEFFSEAGASFECSLDSAGFSACPQTYLIDNIGVGTHTLVVRARDQGGNVDASPASRTWTVTAPPDTSPPNTVIDDGPGQDSTTESTSATFKFSATEAGTFECRLDGGAFESCTSPKGYSGLAVGSHTFQVRASDGSGNVDGSPATRTWKIATVPIPRIEVTLSSSYVASKKRTVYDVLTLKRVPTGASIKVTCKGKRCPLKKYSPKGSGTVKLKKLLKKKLRPGTTLEIRVTKAGFIGKVFSVKIRKGRPISTTLCLPPGVAKPSAC